MADNIDDQSDEMEGVIAQAKAGDTKAFWAIIARLNNRLISHCYSKSFGHPEYEDVASAVLIEFKRSLPTFKETTLTEVRRHLLFLAGNRCKDAHRIRVKMHQLPVDPSGKSIEPAREDHHVGHQLEATEVWQLILKCLHSKDVPDEFIETWRLKKIDGLSYKEIAELLKIAEGTVGSRVNRTDKAIKGCVEGVQS